MMCSRLLLSVAMLLCLTALLFSLSNPALCGPYCGSNPLGDTSGDTDFYVSKNQNQASSSGAATTTGTGVAVKALGGFALELIAHVERHVRHIVGEVEEERLVFVALDEL